MRLFSALNGGFGWGFHELCCDSSMYVANPRRTLFAVDLLNGALLDD